MIEKKKQRRSMSKGRNKKKFFSEQFIGKTRNLDILKLHGFTKFTLLSWYLQINKSSIT